MFNNLRLFYFVISITYVFLLAQSSSANITNGTFDDNLDGWTTEGTVQQWWPGVAQLAPAETYPFEGEPPTNDNSSLSQLFTLEENSKTLSFDVSMDFGETGETDVFTAKLDGTQFYYWDSEGIETLGTNVLLTAVTDDSRTVNLDVSGLLTGIDNKHTLVFNLYNDYTEMANTYIYIDNVNVSGDIAVVPVPGAMLLGCIGAAIVGIFRRVKPTA